MIPVFECIYFSDQSLQQSIYNNFSELIFNEYQEKNRDGQRGASSSKQAN